VLAADEQRDRPVSLERWQELAESVLAEERVAPGAEVSLLFVDKEAIASLNAEFMDRSGPTDVLAFPIDEPPEFPGRDPDAGGTGPGRVEEVQVPWLLGDVVICPEVAWEHAVEGEIPYEEEIAVLVIHGLLHLLGMDHEDDEEAVAMEAREEALLGLYRATWSRKDGVSNQDGDPDQVGGPDQDGDPDQVGGPDQDGVSNQDGGLDQDGDPEVHDR